MIDREFLRRGGLTEALREAAREGLLRLTTPAERRATRAALLADAARRKAPLWLFAYGSLMWNPAFEHVASRTATVHGYHRRLCLRVAVARGTPRNPGLLLGLEPGGSCRGVAYRIAPQQAEQELDIVLAREMVAEGYRPVWVRARSSRKAVWAVSFAIDRSAPTYAERLTLEQTARRIARAQGALGHCADYLEETVAHLQARGIHDRGLEAVRRRVRALRR
jgi:glutathione-specific gamma-glutamylcyclotransferase